MKKERKQQSPRTSTVSGHHLVTRLYPFILICALGTIIYSNTFHSSFQLDDFSSITENASIRNIGDVKTVWNIGDVKKTGTFRIVRFVGYFTFALNYRFNKYDVFGYHVVNVTIHLLNAVLVWWLCSLIMATPAMKRESAGNFARHYFPLGCSVLFLTHPVQIQAVTYIVQRFASLSAFFYLASLCLYINARITDTKPLRYVSFLFSAVLALLGLFTKEIVVTLPFTLFLVEVYFFRTPGNRIQIAEKKGLLLFFGILLLLFLLILPYIFSYNIMYVFAAAKSQRFQDPLLTVPVYFMTQLKVLLYYLKLLFLPLKLNIDHDIPAARSFFEPLTLLGFSVAVFLLGMAVWTFSRNRLVSFGIAWFFVTMSLESIKPLSNVMFEHRLYLPFFGFTAAIISLFRRLFEKQKKSATFAFILIIAFLSLLTYRRNMVWKDEISLWSDAAAKSPGKARTCFNLGSAYNRAGMYEKGIETYRKALSLYPDYPDAYNNMATALSRMGRYEEAERECRKALHLDRWYFNARFNLGNILFYQGRYEEAMQVYRDIIYYTNNPQVFNNLGSALSALGRYEEAVAELRRALELDPEYGEAYRNLGKALFDLGRYAEAETSLRESVKLDPDNPATRLLLGDALMWQKKYDEAMSEYHTALQLKPGNPDAQNRLRLYGGKNN